MDGLSEADSPKGLRVVLRKDGVFLSEQVEAREQDERARSSREGRDLTQALRRPHQAPTTSRS